ncbi:MAG: GntR family transcriptional regulator [Pseudonocardia sp.]|nr:GntR family transcriptional regulator [Pseudonocardia sp.]
MPDWTTWRDIAADLRAAISAGDYPPGTRLPSRAKLTERYRVAPQTVTNAINALRNEGLIVGIAGGGWYVRPQRPAMRVNRRRLSQAERDAGRGAFLTDAFYGQFESRVVTNMWSEPATGEVAAALGIEQGSEVFVRDRVMYRDDVPAQLATSYLPRDLTAGTAIEQENPGPGGIHQRLIDAGHRLVSFIEIVHIGQASEQEAAQLNIPTAAAVFRIDRTAHTDDRAVEVNNIVIPGERVQLVYELPAD